MKTASLRRVPRPVKIALGLAVALLVAAGCGSSSTGNSGQGGNSLAGQTVPTANLPVLKKIGTGEGQLNLIAWEGYLNPIWVKPFEQQTGCQVNAKYAGSSDEMVALMKNGGDLKAGKNCFQLGIRLMFTGCASPA